MYNLISTPFVSNNLSKNQEFLTMSPLGIQANNKQQNIKTTPPDWSVKIVNNKELSPTGTISNENSDDHFSRHLENIIITNDFNKQLEEDEQQDDCDVTNEKNEDDDDTVDPNDEPKVFQVEDVDLPSLVTQNLNNTKSPNTTINLFNTCKTIQVIEIL
jgi:hypothetical protein